MFVVDSGLHHATVNWQWMTALNGIGILVPAAQSELALSLLHAAEQEQVVAPQRKWWQIELKHLGHIVLALFCGIVPPDSGRTVLSAPAVTRLTGAPSKR